MKRYRFDNSIINGKPAHAHYLGDQRLLGTSTVVNIIDKSAPMKWWAVDQATLYLGRTPNKDCNGKFIPIDDRLTPEFLRRYARNVTLSPKEYLAELDNAYKAHSVTLDSAADAGTMLHKELEFYITCCINKHSGVPLVAVKSGEGTGWGEYYASSVPAIRLFSAWAVDNVKRFIASEAHCYSERLQTGGIVDLIYEDNEGNIAILDFKSSKAAYETHFYQAAGYAIAAEENGIYTADGDLIRTFDKPFAYYLTLPYGMASPSPQIGTAKDKELGRDTAKCKVAFEHCVGLYRIVNQ